MRERLQRIGVNAISESCGFICATFIGIIARMSPEARDDWTKKVLNSPFYNKNGVVHRWARWSLMFLNPEDRKSVYTDINFVLEGAKGSS
ncbi:hypothetical protein HYU96_03195 [Candidatus Daviesbacteria bacterium]|nr:hypothetical protein [Candidatus Daviesbacteria bacterium]